MGRGLCWLVLLLGVRQASGVAPPVIVPDGPWEPQYISRAEVLERALRQGGGEAGSPSVAANVLLRDVETAYGKLSGAYCQLFFRELALYTISQTCRIAQYRYEAGFLKRTDFAKARRYFERYRTQRLEAIRTIDEQDRRLRALLGMSRPSHVRLAPDDLPRLPRSPRFQTNRTRRQALARELNDRLETYRSGKSNDHHAIVEAQIGCTEALTLEYEEITAFNRREVELAFARGTIEARARAAIGARLPRSMSESAKSSEWYKNVPQEALDGYRLPRMLHYLSVPQDPSQLFLTPGVSVDHDPWGYFGRR
jgi:hypothetical protein